MKRIIMMLTIIFLMSEIDMSSAEKSSIYHLNRVWELDSIRLVFNGTVDESCVPFAKVYDIEFPMTDSDYTNALSFNNDFKSDSIVNKGDHQIDYISNSGAHLSFSYGDLEYSSDKMKDTYAHLFDIGINHNMIEGNALSEDSIPDLDAIVYREVKEKIHQISAVIGIEYLHPTMVCWLSKDDLVTLDPVLYSSLDITAANPFFGVFFPMKFMNIPVINTSYLSINNTLITGTQGQIIMSSDGVEFFYSGRGIDPHIVGVNRNAICLSFDSIIQFFISSFDSILLDERTEIKFNSAQICYVPIPKGNIRKQYTYMPYWFLYYDEGAIALNAFTGERLI